MEEKIGFDIDGTLCNDWSCKKNYWKHLAGIVGLFLFFNLHNSKITHWYLNWYISYKELQLYPIVSAYIITSRPPWLRKNTIQWLRKYNVLFNSTYFTEDVMSNVERAYYKAIIINNKKVSIYYEDDHIIRLLLRYFCPNTTILEPSESIRRGHAIPYQP